MKTILYAHRRSSIIGAAVTVVLGGVLMCWPDRSVKILCTLLGAAIFISGIIYFLGWLARREEGLPAFFLLPAVILCALGVWLMSSPESVVRLVQYIFGAVLLFHGALDLQGAFALARRRWQRWWVDLLLGALTLVWGLLILLQPVATFSALVMLIGAALVYDGVSDLVLIWRLSRAFRAWEESHGEP